VIHKRNVEDVDLLTGGLLEKAGEGSLVGPTFSCIIAQQFRRLREADRFWYESDIPPAKFTKGTYRKESRKNSGFHFDIYTNKELPLTSQGFFLILRL
jgi:hypothetical protein